MSTRRVAVTGGPGAGKSSLFRALVDSHAPRVVGVPEVATLLLTHVFPAVTSEPERRAVQRAIFHVQRELEDVWAGRASPDQLLLCDRGTADGAGYWPAGADAFFAALGTEWRDELARYDAVLFLESAAHGGHSICGGNDVRTEDLVTAAAIDRRLHAIWCVHPRFFHVPHAPTFEGKLLAAERAFAQLAREL